MKRWLIVGVYAVSLPFLRPLSNWVTQIIAISYLLLLFSVIFGIVVIGRLVIKKEKRWYIYGLWGILCSGTILFVSYQNVSTSIEKVHFIEYGMLSGGIFLALSPYVGVSKIYIYSILIAIAIGIADEGVQAVLPGRFFDIQDILLNVKSVLIGHGFIYLFNK